MIVSVYYRMASTVMKNLYGGVVSAAVAAKGLKVDEKIRKRNMIMRRSVC